MDFKIYYDALYEKVDEIVSLYAARQYGEDGTSLYDSLIIPSNERQRVIGFIDMGMNSLLQRLSDVVTVDTDNPNVLHFYLPDLQPDLEPAIEKAINIYLANYAVAYWFDRVAKDAVEIYLNVAKGAIDNAASLAKTRRKPRRRHYYHKDTNTEDTTTEEGEDEDASTSGGIQEVRAEGSGLLSLDANTEDGVATVTGSVDLDAITEDDIKNLF